MAAVAASPLAANLAGAAAGAGKGTSRAAPATARSGTTVTAASSTTTAASADPQAVVTSAAASTAAPAPSSGSDDSSAIVAAAAAALAANPAGATAPNAVAEDPAAGSGIAGVADVSGVAAAAHAVSHAMASSGAAESLSASTLLDTKDKPSATADGSIGTVGADPPAIAGSLTTNTANPTTDAAATPTVRIHASIDSTEFAQGLSDRVSWMVGNSLNGAKLQVNPPQLGPIELRIAVSGDHAQVWMSAHSAVTRDALESSSPKLREMLGAQGFGQVSVDISQRSFQDRSTFSPPYERTSGAPRSAAASAVVTSVAAAAPRSSLGGLDAYA